MHVEVVPGVYALRGWGIAHSFAIAAPAGWIIIDTGDSTRAATERATAARALGQHTDSANARGFYITEALQMESKLLIDGQPVTLDAIRTFRGTPNAERLTAASLDQNLQFVRYLVDPRKAEDRRLVFTIAVESDPQIRQVALRNSVLVISPTVS